MNCVEDGKYQAMVVSPLVSGRLDPPDIALFLRHARGDDVFHQRTAMVRLQKVRLECRRRVGVCRFLGPRLEDPRGQPVDPLFRRAAAMAVWLDDEMLMALPPEQRTHAIKGMEALAKNGLRYPFPQYGIQQDVRAGMAVSYADRKPAAGLSASGRPPRGIAMTLKPIPGAPVGAPIPDFPTGRPSPLVVPESPFTRRPGEAGAFTPNSTAAGAAAGAGRNTRWRR